MESESSPSLLALFNKCFLVCSYQYVYHLWPICTRLSENHHLVCDSSLREHFEEVLNAQLPDITAPASDRLAPGVITSIDAGDISIGEIKRTKRMIQLLKNDKSLGIDGISADRVVEVMHREGCCETTPLTF